jgi:acyl carrier protein
MDQIKKEIKKLVSEITELPEEELKEDARFAEDFRCR